MEQSSSMCGTHCQPGESFTVVHCDNCMAEIDENVDTHVEIVKPMEFKGEIQKITQFYCTVGCLLEKIRD